MRTAGGILRSVTLGVGLCLVLSGASGCRTEQRTTSVQTTQPADQRMGHAENMATADAERAKADLKSQARPAGAGRPATPPEHAGPRTVDQPRVTPRR